MAKIVIIEEVKIYIFLETWWTSMKYFGKYVTYDGFKSD